MNKKKQYPTYVINLKKRTDRLKSIQNEFKGKNEFAVTIVEAIENSNGAMGLWETLKDIFSKLPDEDFVIICEDDHQFTNAYSHDLLNNYIVEAEKKGVDFLVGGVSWFNEAIQLSENLFSVETFSATQFIVVFKKFFNIIINANFGPDDSADYKIASLSVNKFVIYPFISTQKEFGYSDATAKNNEFGRVTAIFNSSIQRLDFLNKIWKSYQLIRKDLNISPSTIHDSQTIPTYAINIRGNAAGVINVINEFKGKSEFDTTLIEIERKEANAYGLGCFLKKIIKMAIQKNEDLIIICDSTHQFTSHYSKEYLFRNISYARKIGAKIIFGGTERFGSTIAVAETLYWIDWVANAQFIIVDKRAFEEILSIPNIHVMPLSKIYNITSSNKVMFYPFISKRSISNSFNDESSSQQIYEDNSEVIIETYNRLNFIQNEYKRYFHYALID